MSTMQIYTIGHSNHPIEKFLSMLKSFDVEHLVDIRSLPRSRFNPQFNEKNLLASLAAQNITYTHLKSLGGMRTPNPDSVNLAWTSQGLQAYADHMQSLEYQTALAKLIEIAKAKPTAIMCAEKLPENCHRQLTADSLIISGFEVVHILSETSSKPHKLPSFAQVKGNQIIYPLPLFS